MHALMKLLLFLFIVSTATGQSGNENQGSNQKTTAEPLKIVNQEINPEYWLDQAKARIASDCSLFPSLKNGKRPKNVILLLGDGMGMPTISAGRFYNAELQSRSGAAVSHPMEDWPFNTMARTYDLETSVTDSASSATAYLTGTKTRTGMIGVTGALNVKQCGKWPEEHFTQSVLEAAIKAKKATGVVTNTRITHASPAGTYGHVTFRDMESDANIKEFCPDEYEQMPCQDIACQLIQNHQDINVMIGGGQKNFYPNNESLEANKDENGVRLDGRNLVNEWKRNMSTKNRNYCFVGKPEDFATCTEAKPDYLLALPYADHMPYNHEIPINLPSLLDYVRLALSVLMRQKNGFFLFIESGRIDHAHHQNQGQYSLSEMNMFDKIIEYVATTVNLDETLVIVTADHSHSFELVGQPGRFQSVLGLDQYYSNKTLDGMPLQGINYMNGPNGLIDAPRKNPAYDPIFTWAYRQQTLVPLPYASHGGDDVGVYATGPLSAIFHLVVDNTMIANTMKWALGVEPFTSEKDPCDQI